MTKKIVKRTDANNETLYFYTHSDAVDVGEGSSMKSLTEVIDDTLHKSAQTLTNAEKTQVYANLGLNGVDDVPTENSNNIVRSGGVKAAIDDVIDDFTNRGFMYKGIAPASAPLGEDKTFYIAKSGDYTAYTGIGDGSFTLNGIAVLTYATTTGSGAWTKNDIVLFDDKPTTNSNNLVKSSGVKTSIRDAAFVNEDVTSLIGNWVVDGSAITFVSSGGMNGTFTSHTSPNKPATTRPYFRVSELTPGNTYRLKLKVDINSSRATSIGFIYGSRHDVSWAINRLIDKDSGQPVTSAYNTTIDCVFTIVSGKTYIAFSMDAFGIDDSITISDFSLTLIKDINSIDERLTRGEKYLYKMGFVGEGTTFVISYYKHLLKKGHTYKLTVINPWDAPSGSTSSQNLLYITIRNGDTILKTIASVYCGSTIEDEYTFTMEYEDSEYTSLAIGGRADAGFETAIQFEDITAVKDALSPYNDSWPRIFGKDDCYYKARLTSSGKESEVGTNYKYIYRMSDFAHVSAFISSGYTMLIGLYRTFEEAKANSSSRIKYIDTNYASFFRYGNVDIKPCWLSVIVYKSDSTALTDEDIIAIENSLELSICPVSVSGEIESLKKEVVELSKAEINIDDFELFTSDAYGATHRSKTRVKFFYQDIIAPKNISVDVTDVLIDIPTLTYGVAIFDTIDNAKQNASVGIKQSIVSPMTNENTDKATISSSGILNVYFKKNENAAFTYEEIMAMREKVKITVAPISDEETDKNDDYNELPLGEFVSSTSAIVASNYITCVPYLGVTYKFVLPSGIKARIAYGATNNMSSNSSWVENNGSITLPTTAMGQQLQISRTNGAAISVSDVVSYVENGVLKVYYPRLDLPIEQRNHESENYVKAAMYRLGYIDSADVLTHGGLHSMPVIVHSSDFHGDMKRFENVVEYAHFINADTIVTTGDNVMFNSSNGTLYMKDVITKHSGIPFLNCIGNHESQGGTYDNDYLFDNHISPYVEQGNYKATDGVAATLPYYYVDFAEKKLRIIVINQFDNACYGGSGLGGRLGQTQVTWLCNTLLSTPEGYGVIACMHANETKVNTPSELASWNQTVNWNGGNEDTSGYCVSGLYVNTMRPIRTIIDAFISKTQLSTSYVENTSNGNNGETVTIDVDFNNVAEGVEFICYLTGHRHKDNIGYVDGATNKQLMLNIVCSNCHYPRAGSLSFSEGCDIPRGDRGVTQDAFNVYAIDRQNGRVKIARVGSSVNFEGIERKFLIAPYRE